MKFAGIVKIGISVLMLALAFSLVDFNELKNTLMSVPLSVVVLAVVGYTITQMISACRWWLLARAGNIRVPYLTALRVFFIGMYANCFGLGTVGGDLLKGALLTKGTGQKTEAIASAFADRALGLAVLSLIGVIATAFVSGHHMKTEFVYILTGVGIIILLAWLVGPWIILKVVPKGNPFRAKIEQVSEVFHRDPKAILLVCIVAAIFHLSQIALQWMMARGMGIDVSFVSMLVTVPFVNILSTLPVSWNGVGVREKAYIFFFCPDIFTHEQAVAMGALWLLAITAASAIGGILAFLGGGLASIERGANIEKEVAD